MSRDKQIGINIRKSQNARFINRRHQRVKNHANPIIYGYFPRKTYKEIAIARVNKTLCILLAAVVTISIVSYYFVTSSELTLNKLGKETTRLNNENVELQNKLDYLRSFNNVDHLVRSRKLLNTAKQVIEVPAASSAIKEKSLLEKANADSYKWSIGY